MAAAEDHERLFRGDGCGVEGCVGYVGFEQFEVARGYHLVFFLRGVRGGFEGFVRGGGGGNAMYLGGLIFGGGYEVGAVRGPLEVGDLHAVFMGCEAVNELSSLISLVVFSDEWKNIVPWHHIVIQSRLHDLQ